MNEFLTDMSGILATISNQLDTCKNLTILGLVPSVPETFSDERVIDVGEDNQWYCLEQSGQWL